MRDNPTLEEAAASAYPLGIECGHCIRRVVVDARTILNAKRGDRRRVGELALRCARCGSRTFNAVLFQSPSEASHYTRNH